MLAYDEVMKRMTILHPEALEARQSREILHRRLEERSRRIKETCRKPWSSRSVVAMLDALGVGDTLDDKELFRYLQEQESSPYSAPHTMSFFRSRQTGLRYDPGEPLPWGGAWFCFGDACRGGVMVSEALQNSIPERRGELVGRYEARIRKRTVQSQFALFLNESESSRDSIIQKALQILANQLATAGPKLENYDRWHLR